MTNLDFIWFLSNNGCREWHLCAAIEIDRLHLAVNNELLDKRESDSIYCTDYVEVESPGLS
jgi:competence CoiA-like predicted nuclease